MKILATLAALFRTEKPKPPEVVVHAPAPQDLDSPFINEKIQQRVGQTISASVAKSVVNGRKSPPLQ